MDDHNYVSSVLSGLLSAKVDSKSTLTRTEIRAIAEQCVAYAIQPTILAALNRLAAKAQPEKKKKPKTLIKDNRPEAML